MRGLQPSRRISQHEPEPSARAGHRARPGSRSKWPVHADLTRELVLEVPGVTTTGPFNQHFVRDIGLIFLLVAIAMLAGVAKPAVRVSLWSAAALWLTGHALFHFWEVAVDICGPGALARDFPAVTLPAILTSALALWAWRNTAPNRRQMKSVEEACVQ